jgi:hypothetical protein
MFFPGESKMGFVLWSDTIRHWTEASGGGAISEQERGAILDYVRRQFAGHALVIE